MSVAAATTAADAPAFAPAVGGDGAGSVYHDHGATDAEAAELREYARNAFGEAPAQPAAAYPLPDEPFVAAWERYVAESREAGAFEALRRRLVQLRFPVGEGVSQSEPYLAATRRGVLPTAGEGDDAVGLALARPDALRLFIHQTAAGRVPVIVAGPREDFVALARALTCRNEPKPIPDSMGACIISGYNNWDRVATLRRAWEAGGGGASGERAATWEEEFRRIVPRKELYQDRFILLSSGPYSATPAAAAGAPSDAAWLETSLTIRLEHECAHYFTRRVFGSMRNSLLDEVIADYAGIVAAAGRYRADWFLRFMGAEDAGGFRAGGRLENYRGTPPLSDGAFAVLQALVRRVAAAVERFDAALAPEDRTVAGVARVISALGRLGLERLASSDGADALHAELRRSLNRA